MSDRTTFTHTYHTIPRETKLAWGDGAWVDEPDKAQWQDETTGLPCLLVRNPGGALCGYVGVYPTHPYHGKAESHCREDECIERMRIDVADRRARIPSMTAEEAHLATMCVRMDELMLKRKHARCTAPPGEHITEYAVDVHGGVTFSDFCAHDEDAAHGICHIEKPGEPPVWWLGFDCAHAGDLMPKHEATMRQFDTGKEYEKRFAALHAYDQYRDVAYVVEQCTQLASQLAMIEAACRE